MSGRLYLGTLGFHENFMARTLHVFAAGDGDGLLLVTLRPVVSGVKLAMRSLGTLSLRLGIKNHGHVEIDPSAPIESIGPVHDTIVSTVEREGYTEIVADLSGGPRMVVVSTFIALLLVSERVPVRLIVQNETGIGGSLDLKLAPLVQALRGMGVKGKILRLVAERPGMRQEEIAGELGISEKTAANYISQLARLGLVARRGRVRGVYPTGLGRLLARLV